MAAGTMCSSAKAQTDAWAWIAGSSTLGGTGAQPGVYGALGQPAPGNLPGGRGQAVTWTDQKGNLWLFGGYGTDTTGDWRFLNDLWEINPASNEWTWISGSSTVTGFWGQAGLYGTLGQPGTENVPGGRFGASGWTDSSGNLWLFGGWGCESAATNGFPDTCYFNDLWKFNPAARTWAWMGGSNTTDQSGVYGSLSNGAATNTPGSRDDAASWTDTQGNFWLFGGYGYDSAGTLGYLNDLWEFSISTNEWTWVGGSNVVGGIGTYGPLGTSGSSFVPGSRSGSIGWTDSKGNLWLFGGYGLDADGTPGQVILNDFWKFDIAKNQWTWMSGSSTVNNCFNDGSGNGVASAVHCAQASTYGEFGVPAAGNTPGSREGAIGWTDSKGNLWLFGGWSFDVPNQVQYYFDELWEFDTSTNRWAWMGGSSTRDGSACAQNVNLWVATCGEPGSYGTIVTPASGNIPGGRSNAASWTDSSGNLWLFSGSGFDANGNFGDKQWLPDVLYQRDC
jgi:N-acetylneuraminic acid mutarotase